ncbi:MAG: Dabb family protein [Eubacteriales bacterium]
MIRHIVMWKLKDFAEGNSKAENAAIIKKSLEALPQKIKQIKRLEVGLNVNPSDQAYDAVLVSDFNSMEELAEYRDHPEHKKVQGFVHAVIESRAVADYEL